MYYRSVTNGYSMPMTSHALGQLAGSRRTLLHIERRWKYGVISNIRLRQSMRIYL